MDRDFTQIEWNAAVDDDCRRLTRLAEELLGDDIAKETVEWAPNYDGSMSEPTVLPSQFPNLLVNGSSGIAVGMATNIPPHNLREVVNACLRLIRNRELSVSQLMMTVKGPDFPVACEIRGIKGIESYFATGRGSVKMRGKMEFDELYAVGAVALVEYDVVDGRPANALARGL